MRENSYSKFVEKKGIVFTRIFHPYYTAKSSTHILMKQN